MFTRKINTATQMLLSGILGLVILFGSLAQLTAAEKVYIEIEPNDIDLGTHSTGEKISVVAKIFNRGTKAVSIRKVKASCACSKAEPGSWRIESGSSVDLTIEVDSIHREGELSQTIWVLTDEPQNPIHRIRVSGRFVASDHRLIAYPSRMNVGTANPNSYVSQVFRIFRGGNVSLGLITTSLSAEWATVEIDKQRTTKEKLYLNATVHVPANLNKIKEELLIKSSDPNDFIRIPIIGTIAPPIKIFPDLVLVTRRKKNIGYLSIKTMAKRQL